MDTTLPHGQAAKVKPLMIDIVSKELNEFITDINLNVCSFAVSID